MDSRANLVAQVGILGHKDQGFSIGSDLHSGQRLAQAFDLQCGQTSGVVQR